MVESEISSAVSRLGVPLRQERAAPPHAAQRGVRADGGSTGRRMNNVVVYQRCSESRQTEKVNELWKERRFAKDFQLSRRYLCKCLQPSSTCTRGKIYPLSSPLLENSLSASGVN